MRTLLRGVSYIYQNRLVPSTHTINCNFYSIPVLTDSHVRSCFWNNVSLYREIQEQRTLLQYAVLSVSCTEIHKFVF